MNKTYYVIDDGDIFDGTIEQFKDCFFSNADEETVSNWCKQEGFTLEVVTKAKDFFGNEITVGDEVAFYAPGYRMFTIGKIVAFTPKQVRVSYTNTWNYGKPGREDTYLGYPDMYIKKVEV